MHCSYGWLRLIIVVERCPGGLGKPVLGSGFRVQVRPMGADSSILGLLRPPGHLSTTSLRPRRPRTPLLTREVASPPPKPCAPRVVEA